MLKSALKSLAVIAVAAIGIAVNATNNKLTLRYDRPAEFFEEALVIGNGTMGGIIYGGTNADRISLNDITLWTGEPDTAVYNPDAWKVIPDIRKALFDKKFDEAEKLQKKVQGHFSENYQPVGCLTITYPDSASPVTAYTRQLDLSEAVASTTYTCNGAAFATEYFASAPDEVMVITLTSEASEGIDAVIGFDSLLPFKVEAENNQLTATGYAAYHSEPVYHGGKHYYDPERGTRFAVKIAIEPSDEGSVSPLPDGSLSLKNAKNATVYLTIATSFNGFDKNPATEGRDYLGIATERLNKAMAKGHDALKRNHVADYSRLFGRMSLDLGQTDPDVAAMTTDRRLKRYTDETGYDPELEADRKSVV